MRRISDQPDPNGPERSPSAALTVHAACGGRARSLPSSEPFQGVFRPVLSRPAAARSVDALVHHQDRRRSKFVADHEAAFNAQREALARVGTGSRCRVCGRRGWFSCSARPGSATCCGSYWRYCWLRRAIRRQIDRGGIGRPRWTKSRSCRLADGGEHDLRSRLPVTEAWAGFVATSRPSVPG
jgi:hypothetical protein